MSNYDSWVMIAIVVVFAVVIGVALFMLFRNVILWYYQITKRVEQLDAIRAYLMLIAKAQDPIGFKKFQDTIKGRANIQSTIKKNPEMEENQDSPR